MTRALACLAATVLLLSGMDPVAAYRLAGSRWRAGSSIVVHFQQGLSGGPLWDGSADWDSVTEGALRMWAPHVDGLSLSGVTRAVTRASLGNSVNDVAWADDLYGESFGSAVSATISLSQNGVTKEVDVLFDRNRNWNSYRGPLRSGSNGGTVFDLRRAAVHEFGHLIGLGHAGHGEAVPAVMNGPLSAVESPQLDDLAGARAIYESAPSALASASTQSCTECDPPSNPQMRVDAPKVTGYWVGGARDGRSDLAVVRASETVSSLAGGFANPTVGPDPIEPFPTVGYDSRLKSPGQRMRFTAGLPLRLLADGSDPHQWTCPPGRPPYACTDNYVEFFVDGASVGRKHADPNNQGMWEVRLPDGLAAGDHVLTCVYVPHDPTNNDGGDPIPCAVPVTISVDPLPKKARTIDLTADLVLSGATPLDWSNTLVRGHGFRVRAAAGYSGKVTLDGAFVTGLATYGSHGLDISTTGAFSAIGTTFEATAPLKVTAGTCTIRGAEFRANNFVTYVSANPDASAIAELTCDGSPVLAGVNSGGGQFYLRGQAWQVGGLTRELANVLIGPRSEIRLFASGSAVRGTYSHHEYASGWSQGFNLVGQAGESMLAEHNVIRNGSWLIQSFCGEFRHNLVLDSGAHNSWRSACNGTQIHHNVFANVANNTGSGVLGTVYTYSGEQDLVATFNTFDAGGLSAKYNAPALHVASGGGTYASVTDNVFTGYTTPSTSAIVQVSVTAKGGNRFFNPLSSAPPYAGGGLERTDASGDDPQFARPRDEPYKLQTGLLWTREISVFDVLHYYREMYTPRAGSPVLGKGAMSADAADRFGQLGAGAPTSALAQPDAPAAIWIDAPKLAWLKASAAAKDPDWLAVKAAADRWLTFSVPPFSRDDCGAEEICYAYQGHGWLSAVQDLGFAFQVTGHAPYAEKVKAILAVLNAAMKQGNLLPFSADSGYPSRTVALMIGLAYAWTGTTWDSALKTETWASLNAGFDWFVANAYERDGQAISNYFGGHILGFGVAGLATAGVNPRGQEIADHIRAKFARVHEAFLNGGFAGGYPAEGYVYGTNHFVRLLQYALAVRTATGEDLLSTGDYATKIARNLIYNLKPNDWQFTDEANYSGDNTGIMDTTLPVMLTSLAPTPWNGYMRYLYENLKPPVSMPVWPNIRLLFGDRSVASVDYRTALPSLYDSPGDQHLYVRSDWSRSAVWASFHGSAAFAGGHAQRSAGHIAIQRGNDYLLVNSGQWKGPDGWGGNPQAFDDRGWRTNTLWYRTTWDASYLGGQGFWGSEKILLYREEAAYVVKRVDLTSAYNRSTDLQRFIRTFVAFRDGTYVVHDDIVGPNEKVLYWHFNPNGVPQVDKTLTATTVGASRLFLRTLLPAAPTLTVAPDPVSDTDPRTTTYRVEVRDSNAGSNLTALHVLQATSKETDAMVPTELLKDNTGVGARIGARQVWFRTDGTVVIR